MSEVMKGEIYQLRKHYPRGKELGITYYGNCIINIKFPSESRVVPTPALHIHTYIADKEKKILHELTYEGNSEVSAVARMYPTAQ